MEDGKDITGIENLFEFYRHWPELRNAMLDLANSDRLREFERTILKSMIATVDRVGPNDLHHDVEP
ncbi:hypothetical protein [Maritimibacter dapengensis]|uniref:Uncharacterized protein n=1 Tax=Maritimibacter dapengensis TaxID=2836868 RepID=A0ABS6SXC6_9RHOB|nr:hypothetical protein [Maritimibacter dapengensis]MBV7377619.1 hypothetical protein [Maritimibacter dapengensis]